MVLQALVREAMEALTCRQRWQRGQRRVGRERGARLLCRAKAGSTGSSAGTVKLAKALAEAGVGSRRACEAMIAEGKVRVNGRDVVDVAERVNLAKDDIRVGEEKVRGRGTPPPQKIYLAVNKPRGYICSNKEPEGKGKRVVDLAQRYIESAREKRTKKPPRTGHLRLFTVGRLDVNTTGLIFVTNDGDWANKVAHPRYGITKEYVATAQRYPTHNELRTMLNRGAVIDGNRVLPLRCDRVVNVDGGSANRVLVEVQDGKKHEVRELFHQAGVPLKKLSRVRVGGFVMPSSLKPGDAKELKPHEVKKVLSKSAQANVFTNSYAPPAP